MPVGAMLGTAAANMGPNIAWLWTQRPEQLFTNLLWIRRCQLQNAKENA